MRQQGRRTAITRAAIQDITRHFPLKHRRRQCPVMIQPLQGMLTVWRHSHKGLRLTIKFVIKNLMMNYVNGHQTYLFHSETDSKHTRSNSCDLQHAIGSPEVNNLASSRSTFQTIMSNIF